MRSSSRALAAVAVAVAVATGAAACSSGSSSSSTAAGSAPAASSGSGSSAPTASLTMWVDTTGPSPANTALQDLAASFDKSHPGDNISVQLIPDAQIKTKLQTAMGAGNEPQMFWTWGGGPLQSFIKAGKVTPLGTTESAPYLKQFLPSTLGAVTVNGQVYGVPVEGTQPVYFFYNKKVFSQNNLTFPKTFKDLLSDVATLKSKGIIPISLGEADQWPGLMYIEYLADRIGGPSVASALQSGTAGAWSNPAITQALTDIQTLVKAGAFGTNYNSTHFNGQSDALVYSGKAAMQLMGDWDISSIEGTDPSFVTGGNLGMAPFPSVEGGSGDPADLAGNTASYESISTNVTPAQKAVAEEFLSTMITSPDYTAAEVKAGEVPAVSGASSLFTGNLAEFDTTIYNSVQSAPNFQYSWDQALPPAQATPMLSNLQQIFNLKETPAQFVAAMNAVK
jgi:raffinose/stachyose/melibiose transport system substrate-binding protein